ncbi:MAG: universal stress protein, partial [Bacilli bacterium]|nr:universal stress protein [Bacilli bacterium]
DEQVEYEEINLYDNNAKRQIVQYAKENKIDLIVIGSSGTSKTDELYAHSITKYVVNHAPCNVMVVK